MATGFYLQDNRTVTPQFRRGRRERVSGVIVLHSAENTPDIDPPDTGAENVASWLTRRTDYGSYHRLVDSDSIIPLVDFANEAFHDATDHGNWHEIGLSVATRADQWPRMPDRWRKAAIENLAVAAREAMDWVFATRGITVPRMLISRAASQQRIPGFITHALRDPARRSDPGFRDAEWNLFWGVLKDLSTPASPVPPNTIPPTIPPAPPDTGDLTVADITEITRRLDAIDKKLDSVAQKPRAYREPGTGRVYQVAAGTKLYIPNRKVLGGHALAGQLASTQDEPGDAEFLASLYDITPDA